MTQDERWMVRYNEVKAFIEGNKRRPSKYIPEERNAWNWLRHTQKQYGLTEPSRQEFTIPLLDSGGRGCRCNKQTFFVPLRPQING